MARPRTVTREDVDAVALDLFLDRGFAAVTGQQLATAAGISRPTLYRLVGRIEDIVLDQLDGSLEDLLGAVRLSAGPPWRVLRDAFVGVLEAVEPGSPRAKEILDHWAEYRPKFRKVMPVEYRRALEEMERMRMGIAAE